MMDLDIDKHEAPALPDLSDSQNNVDVKSTKKKNKNRKRKKTNCTAVKSDVNACGTPENPLPDLSDSQNNVEVKSTTKKKNQNKKRKKTKCTAVKSDVNACDTPENTLSLKTSTSALDMSSENPVECVSTDALPSEHPTQCVSTDVLMSKSCVETDICLGENEEKEQNIINQAAEKGNGEGDIQDKGRNCNSVVADAELFAKESVSEVVKMNIEQSINSSSSNREDTSDSVKNGGLIKNHDEDLEVHDLSGKSRCIKTYSRKKLSNDSCEGNLDCPSPVYCNKEPTIQDHQNDDSHKVSDGPLTDDFMEIETEHSTDQNKVEDEEIELIAENNAKEKSTTTSSVEDTPVTQLEETNARQVDHVEVTRNDTCCPGDVSDLSLVAVNGGNSKIPQCSVTQLEETNARQADHVEVTRNDMCCPGDVSDLSLVAVNGGNSKISQCSVERTIISNSKNKLLILDVNGLLADCVSDVPNGYYQPEPHFWVRRRKVYKRPFCDDFLQFCFDKFHVGVWSSRTKSNVDEVIKCLMGKSASRLLFCWNQSHCTTTKFSTVENLEKPLVLKELRKLWEKLEPGLPWEKGEFHESNTLLLDDSPYKALVNPKYTAIFPQSYRYFHSRDSALGPKGDLRGYLERLAMADNVQKFVELNPFGQRPIREANPSWGYYLKVIESVKCREKDRPSSAPDKQQTS